MLASACEFSVYEARTSVSTLYKMTQALSWACEVIFKMVVADDGKMKVWGAVPEDSYNHINSKMEGKSSFSIIPFTTAFLPSIRL